MHEKRYIYRRKHEGGEAMTGQRKELVRLVNWYASMTKQNQRSVWSTLYNLLRVNHGVYLRNYQDRKGETLLDVAERVGVMHLLCRIMAQMIDNVRQSMRLHGCS